MRFKIYKHGLGILYDLRDGVTSDTLCWELREACGGYCIIHSFLQNSCLAS